MRDDGNGSWIVDRWRELAVGACLAVAGIGAIAWGVHLEKDGFPRGFLETLGKALFAGAIIELIFAVGLVNSILERVRRTQKDLATQILQQQARFEAAGVEGIDSEFEHGQFLEDVRALARSKRPFDVAVMQSWVFNPTHFLQIVQAALLNQSAAAATIKILLLHPDSASGIDRFLETHGGMTRGSAQDAMRSGLISFLDMAVKDPKIAKLLDAVPRPDGASLQIGLHSHKVPMSLYRAGDKCSVGWFPLGEWCVDGPHVRCARVVKPRVQHKHTIAGLACDQFDKLWNQAGVVVFRGGRYCIPDETPPSASGEPKMPVPEEPAEAVREAVKGDSWP